MPRPRYEITLEDAASAGEVPAVHRLRSLLKAALRAYRLRCIRVVEVDASGHEVDLVEEPTKESQP